MSSSLIVAAVTEVLRKLLLRVDEPLSVDPATDTSLSGADVSTLPPKFVPLTDGKHRLNLFLFQVRPNPGLRNLDVPARAAPGAPPALGVALDLYYLLTAYGAQNNEIASHRLIGRAMAILGDGGVLPNVRFALQQNATLQDSGTQLEHVRIVPHQLSMEDMSKLWTILQADYRLSVCYLVTVAIIDALRPVSASLPVLGARSVVQVDPAPRLTAAVPPFGRPSALLGGAFSLGSSSSSSSSAEALPGDTVVLRGENLNGELSLVLRNVERGLRFQLAPLSGASRTELRFSLPHDPSGWVAGLYAVSAAWQSEGVHASSNEVPLPIAPRLSGLSPNPVDRSLATTVTAQFSPPARPEQRVSLLVGGRELKALERPDTVAQASFDVGSLAAGSFLARLRVDGVDSPVTNDSAAVLEFSPTAPRLGVIGSPP